jgi:hypothetical protein
MMGQAHGVVDPAVIGTEMYLGYKLSFYALLP